MHEAVKSDLGRAAIEPDEEEDEGPRIPFRR
jgi:hypothetical protein